jgi:hypothetical protein
MMPPFSFNVDVSSIYEEKCSTVSFQDALPSIKGKVFSFYYPWYANPDGPSQQWYHWEDVTREDIFNADNYPLLGPYDSKDMSVILAHMEMAKQAGIDGLICSWWGINSFEDQGMRRILQVAADTGMEISIYYESVRDLTPQQIIEELSYAVREYGGDPAFMKDQGRPVVFIYTPGYNGRDSKFWVEVRRGLEDVVGPVALIGDNDQLGMDLSDAFDGFHNYIYLGDDPQEYYLAAIGRMALGRPRSVSEAFTQAYAGQPGIYYYKPFLFTISPGFDNTDWNLDGIQVSRENGQRYMRFWEAAIDLQAYTVLLTSWNEWHEGTELEPSREHGFTYLNLTRNFTSRYKDEPVLTPTGDYSAVLKELKFVTKSKITGTMEINVVGGSPMVIVDVKAAAMDGVKNLEINYGVPSYYCLKQSNLTDAVIPSIIGNLPIKFEVEGEGRGALVSVEVTAYDPSGRVYVIFMGDVITPPRPANITVRSLQILKASVNSGEEVEVTATLENVGEQRGNYTIVFKLDGVEKGSFPITLNGRETITKTIMLSSEVVGVHQVSVGDKSLTMEVKQTGIPGYPLEAIIIGLMLVLVLIHRKNLK